MQKLRISLALFFLCAFISMQSFSAQPSIERIEPRSWWVGMKHDTVQLMVHGVSIATAVPRINYPGVRIEAFTPAENPNYLFVTLRLNADVKPGVLPLEFKLAHSTLRFNYPLLEREKNSATRRGFANRDVILNLMPDRFANGDTRNDTVAGFLDPLNRGDDSAGRHGGDIQGIIDHLDYIADMGYTMLWPTPLTQSNQVRYSYHGYATTDAYAIDARYGSNDDYRRLVKKAAEKGVGVILDFVPNHIGSNHWWIRDLPSRDWLTHDGQFVPTQHRRSTTNDPYAAQADRDNFTQGWFEPNMPDMNQKNPHVAMYQIQNCIWWIEFAGLSGVRIDTYGYSDHDFLIEWQQRLRDEYPNLNFVGEEWSLNPVVVSYWLREQQNKAGVRSSLRSVMDFPLHDTLRRALNNDDSMHTGWVELYEALANDVMYPVPENLVLFEGNHDVSRLFSALDDNVARYKMALTFVLTAPRIPQLYYGTEVLMQSTKHRDDGAFRRDFPGGWSGDVINAFTGEGLNPAQKEAQAFVKKLLNWRKTADAIHHGKLLHFAPDNGSYVYFRYLENQRVMVAMNKNTSAVELDTTRFEQLLKVGTLVTDVLDNAPHRIGDKIKLPARSVSIYQWQER